METTIKQLSRGKNTVTQILKDYMLVLFVILLCVIFNVINPKFLGGGNMQNLLRQTAVNAIISIGMLIPIITGGIDLSVGAVSSFAGVLVAGFLTNNGMGIWPACILVMIIGVGIGAFTGFLVTFMNIAPFIATLAVMTIIEGIKYIYCQSVSIFIVNERFMDLGSGSTLNIANPIWLMLIVAILMQLVMSKTVYGRSLYALGGNRSAARLAGINTNTMIFSAYIVSAVCTTFAGLILASRLGVGSPLAGATTVNNCIAGVVIGGGSLAGGRGKPSMVLFGAFVIGMVANFLNLMGVQSYTQKVFVGIIIILAVYASERSKSKKA